MTHQRENLDGPRLQWRSRDEDGMASAAHQPGHGLGADGVRVLQHVALVADDKAVGAEECRLQLGNEVVADDGDLLVAHTCCRSSRGVLHAGRRI